MSAVISPMPSFPPPVSPAPSQASELPAGSPGAPAQCLSMTTMTISTMTFSWCAQVATATPSVVAGGYAFSAPADFKSPEPSTMSTIVVRSPQLAPATTIKRDGPLPSSCGNAVDMGNFTLNLNDIPHLGLESNQDSQNVDPMPMLSPYHRFWFSPGFDVLPLPPNPSKSSNPSSGDLMLQFTPSSISNLSASDFPADAAKISVGPQKSSSCFSFNFYGFSLGCDSKDSCAFNVTGMQFDQQSGEEREVVWQTINVPACPTASDCKLTPITVAGFVGLTSLQIALEVNDEPRTWWADDLALGWFDNQCEMAICRSKVDDSVRKLNSTTTGQKVASKRTGFRLFRG
ncbi:hypothetical protein F4779DRAFT_179201 [Xylariaceae sp. FL0662B]|nr:hypothetical protein F4779DRAFT_179201 [Xylariaceae sp. FL0662B]